MLITAYRLAGIVIYPQSWHTQGRPDPIISDRWFIMPGRQFVHIDNLKIIANKLNRPLVKIEIPFQMPLDRERRQ